MILNSVSERWRSRSRSMVRCWTRISNVSVSERVSSNRRAILQGDGYLVADGARQLDFLRFQVVGLVVVHQQQAVEAMSGAHLPAIRPTAGDRHHQQALRVVVL